MELRNRRYDPAAGKTREQPQRHADERVNHMIFLLVIGTIHFFRSGQTDALDIGEQHPVQKAAVVS